MGIVADFGELLVHQISWEQRVSVDSYGKASFGAAIVFTARIDYKRRNFVNAQGQIILTRGTVVIGGTPLVQPGDRITLPDGSTPPILDASTVDDLEGVAYHTEVTFG